MKWTTNFFILIYIRADHTHTHNLLQNRVKRMDMDRWREFFLRKTNKKSAQIPTEYTCWPRSHYIISLTLNWRKNFLNINFNNKGCTCKMYGYFFPQLLAPNIARKYRLSALKLNSLTMHLLPRYHSLKFL